jgi:acyl-coenzyme A thioesterase PaaI-like protein
MPGSVPPGFKKFETESPFNLNVGPYYFREEDDAIVFGLKVENHHCNTAGRLHGGMVGALADIALGHGIAKSQSSDFILSKANAAGRYGFPMATLSLSTDYSGTAHKGDWLEVHVEVQHVGKSTAFANAYVQKDSTKIARVSGIYKLFRDRTEAT